MFGLITNLAREEATHKADTGTLNAARVTGKTQAYKQFKDKTNGRNMKTV